MNSEVECPVCDCRAPYNSKKCPNCGSDLGMASIDDLERVAYEIANNKSNKLIKSDMVTSKAEADTELKIDVKSYDMKEYEKSTTLSSASTSGESKLDERRTLEEQEKEDAYKDKEPKKGLSRLFGKKKK